MRIKWLVTFPKSLISRDWEREVGMVCAKCDSTFFYFHFILLICLCMYMILNDGWWVNSLFYILSLFPSFTWVHFGLLDVMCFTHCPRISISWHGIVVYEYDTMLMVFNSSCRMYGPHGNEGMIMKEKVHEDSVAADEKSVRLQAGTPSNWDFHLVTLIFVNCYYGDVTKCKIK